MANSILLILELKWAIHSPARAAGRHFAVEKTILRQWQTLLQFKKLFRNFRRSAPYFCQVKTLKANIKNLLPFHCLYIYMKQFIRGSNKTKESIPSRCECDHAIKVKRSGCIGVGGLLLWRGILKRILYDMLRRYEGMSPEDWKNLPPTDLSDTCNVWAKSAGLEKAKKEEENKFY